MSEQKLAHLLEEAIEYNWDTFLSLPEDEAAQGFPKQEVLYSDIMNALAEADPRIRTGNRGTEEDMLFDAATSAVRAARDLASGKDPYDVIQAIEKVLPALETVAKRLRLRTGKR